MPTITQMLDRARVQREDAERREQIAIREARAILAAAQSDRRELSAEDNARIAACDTRRADAARARRDAAASLKRWEDVQAEEREVERQYAVTYETDAARSASGVETNVPPLWADHATVERAHAAAIGGESLRLSTRAAVTTTTSGAAGLGVQVELRPRNERRIAVAAGLVAENVAGVTSVQYPIFGAGDAGITTEGSAKTEYSNITPGEATPQMISLWTDVTRQTVLTMTNFEAKLNTVLSAKVARREDVLVTSTVLGVTGIQTLDMATPDPDAVLEAAGMVAAGDVASEPNLALVNPTDLPALVGSNVGTGGSASPDFGAFLPRLHGMLIYPTTAITAGQVLVGAWNVAAHLVVGLAPTLLVDSLSGVKTNMITMLLEEAVAIAVDEPAGFVHCRPGV